jgi:hypothetical protein
VSLGSLALAGIALLYPLPLSSVPEWKIHVVDPIGKPVSGERVHEEWMDPGNEGVTYAMEAATDSNGWVVFPKHTAHVVLADVIFYRFSNHTRSRFTLPSAHAFVCMQNLDGYLDWDGAGPRPVQQLVLHAGSCGLD